MSNWSPLWDVVPLKDIAEFRNGINFGASSKGRGIKVIGVRDFQDYVDVRYDELDEINPEGVVRPEDLLHENDFVFVRSNGNRALIGRSLFVRNLQEKVTHSGFTIRLRFTTARMLPEFFAQLIRSDLARDEISHFGSGTNISNLSQEILGGLVVPLPPLAEQRAIAAILSTWDEAITLTTRLIDALKRRKQALMQLLLTGGVRFPGFDGEWETLEFGEFVVRGSHQINPVDAEIDLPVVELEHIESDSGRVLGSTWLKQQKSTKNMFSAGQVLFGKLRPYLRKYARPDFDGAASSEIWVLEGKHDLCLNEYLYYLVQTDAFMNMVNVTSGTKMPRADWEYVGEIPLSLPSLPEQARIAAVLETCDEQIGLLLRTRDEIALEKRGLMQQLLTGEVRVQVGN